MNKYFLAGYIAGEGSFAFHPTKGTVHANIYFVVESHIRDTGILEEINKCIGKGLGLRTYPKRPNMVRLQIGGIQHLKEVVIPFFDEYLIGSYKKDQYLAWREKVMNKVIHRNR